MTDDVAGTGKQSVSVNLPIGGMATVAVLALAALGYLVATRGKAPKIAIEKPRALKGNVRRRLGLTALIAIIENDAARKVLVAVLRAISRRS